MVRGGEKRKGREKGERRHGRSHRGVGGVIEVWEETWEESRVHWESDGSGPKRADLS